MRDIKKEYKMHIIIYFILYLFILNTIVFKINIVSLFNDIAITNEFLIKIGCNVILIPISSVMSLVILNIIPTKIKNMLIFWKINQSLPSYRLDKTLKSDDRINLEVIKRLYGKRLSAQKQHDNWYKCYKKNENDIRVIDSQKNYLFSRDLCVSTIILFFISNISITIGYLIYNSSHLIFIYNILVLISLYIMFMIVSRNNANRFVCNVLITEYSKI